MAQAFSRKRVIKIKILEMPASERMLKFLSGGFGACL
jgi:hypothetical protein